MENTHLCAMYDAESKITAVLLQIVCVGNGF